MMEKVGELPFNVKDLRCVRYDLKPRPLFNGTYQNELTQYIRELEQRNFEHEPLLARYGYTVGGISNGLLRLPSNQTNNNSKAVENQCSGLIVDLIHIQRDRRYEKTPESVFWRAPFRKGRLRLRNGVATLTSLVEVFKIR